MLEIIFETYLTIITFFSKLARQICKIKAALEKAGSSIV